MVIIGLLLFTSFWEFLVCIILGASELYLSRKDVLSGTFLVSVSFPINFYIVLAVLIIIAYNNDKFETLKDIINYLNEHSRGYGAAVLLLIIFSVLFIFWMLLTLILSGSNQGNLVFNSFSFVFSFDFFFFFFFGACVHFSHPAQGYLFGTKNENSDICLCFIWDGINWIYDFNVLSKIWIRRIK